jgi:hypothetical protein
MYAQMAGIPHRNGSIMLSAKIVAWISVVSGFAWFSYFAVPVMITNTILVAQGAVPDWSFKDMANLGGFAVFAAAMFFLHRESIKTFREELKSERDTRAAHFDKVGQHLENHAAGVLANTAATQSLTVQVSNLAAEMRNK